MQDDLTLSECEVLAELLDSAGDTFSNHGCNEFDLAKLMPDVDERRELMRQFEDYNHSPEDFDPNDDYETVSDWTRMLFFAWCLRGGRRGE